MTTTEDGLPPLREVIAALDLRARRSLGQNYLLDFNLTRKIARAAAPLAEAVVLEIGPGPGGLTRALLIEGASRVIAIERDERFRPALEAIAARYPGRLDLHFADALATDERALLASLGIDGGVEIVANLPYNVGTALLIKWLEAGDWPPWWRRATLLFQREVAERLIAVPRTKAYGRLAILAAYRTRARLLFDIPAAAFTPPPKVTSTLVQIEANEAPVASVDLQVLTRLTQAAFGQRRKMLRAALRTLDGEAEALLTQAGIAPTARAEELGLAEFVALARVFADRGRT